MKAISKQLFLISLLVGASAAWPADGVDISSCVVEGIGLGTSAGDIKEVYGEPDRRNQPCKDCIDMPYTSIAYDGLRIAFINLEAIHIEVASDEYRLLSGLGVGSSRSEVVAEYGDPSVIQNEDGEYLSYAITVRNGRWAGLTLVFLMDDDSVLGFKIGPKRVGSIYP